MYISFVQKIKNAGRISQKLRRLVTYRSRWGKYRKEGVEIR